ncbi:iron ABC transporter permease [Wolbachia endosymbiont of Brugia malayi]|uniref:ABC transporter permease n=1 Tax=Wolbachia endosymbiont of Brugia malayi TaxID=80849 RepID=UPI00004C9238|nr:iron ABC transporter permease [Wolbachia endosymbiont of Brugia malayi]AAW70631.1 ABC-type Fe3+ transport system, permease component [Wolbachia endosymbiont strain TRS of Brugia malayi]QCB61618.1 iron ABC transporter permease [Wolbachia endosymbiont of Brugia malayi]
MFLKVFKSIFLFLVSILFVCPILSLVSILFTESTNSEWVISTLFPEYILNTLILMIGVGSISFIFGVIPAWLTTFFSFPGSRIFEVALFFPISIPGYIISFVYVNSLEFSGPTQSLLREIFHWGKGDYWFPEIKSLGGGILVMGFSLYTYVYILVRSNLKNVSNSVTVASTLGFSSLQSLFSVVIPSIRPSIIAGISLVLMEVITDFGTPQFLAIDTFTTGIYRTWFLLHDKYSAAVLAVAELVFITALIAVEKILQKKEISYSAINTNSDYHNKRSISGAIPLVFAYAMCILPILVGFALPIIPLIYWSIEKGFFIYGARFYNIIANSIGLSFITAMISVSIAIMIGCTARKNKVINNIARLISLGYAIPNAVIAISIIIFLSKISSFITQYFTEISLVGTVGALIYSYLFRFFAISFKAIESGLKKTPNEIEWIAYTMGHGPISTCLNIHIPLIKKSILSGFLLVFMDTIKELTATLIIRPFNFETISTRIYELVSDERYREAAPFSLMIVITGLISTIILFKLDDENKK